MGVEGSWKECLPGMNIPKLGGGGSAFFKLYFLKLIFLSPLHSTLKITAVVHHGLKRVC